MAMEMDGNLFGYSLSQHNCSNYAAFGMAESSLANSAKKKEAEKTASEKTITGKTATEKATAGKAAAGKTAERAGSGKSKGAAEYINELAKLAPSVEFRVGNIFSTAKSGQTLTINPKLLEKMRKDPEKEKEMKELIRGVESMTRLADGMNKASGWKTVFRHSYIDENGKYCHIALVRNEFMLNMSDELREERRKNAEKLMEKTKEKAAKRKEELEEMLEEKMAASKDGMVSMDDAEFRTILEAMKEDKAGKTDKKEQTIVGANLDLKI